MTETETSSIRVLVVDDQRTMREIIRRLLGQIGVRDVDDAEDGEQALEKLHNPTAEKPDIVICDLHMDKMDGMDFCNHVRRDKNDAIRGLPIIILTGEQDTFVHDVTKQVGATTVLVKPVSAEDLKTQIEAAIGFTI
ncbi:MAG: response regulator [Proteobacteria bacterium]|nr:response regulator [Pseudomonadota bacterium]